MDARASAAARVAVATNVFELCVLKTLTWRVFAAHSSSAASAADAHASTSSHAALDAFAAFAGSVKQQNNALYAWQHDHESSDAADQLWVFSVNHAQKLPTPSASAPVEVVTSGEWTAMAVDALPENAQRLLFRALHVWLARKLLGDGVFSLHSELFTLNEARFVYRTPSLTRANHFDVYLDEAHAASGFQLHVQLLQPSQTLCVNVHMLHRTTPQPPLQPELGSLTSAWLRTLGLPRGDDHSMVDVWHSDDNLMARAVAETKYEGIYPTFRALPRKKAKRRKGENGADGVGGDDDDAAGKNGKNDDHEDADEDVDGAADGDADGDDAARRNGSLGNRKRRRKAQNDLLENDESIAPVSPDTHVNSPEASGPVVQMTFPQDPELSLHIDSEIHIFKRRRRKKNQADQNGGVVSFGPLLTPVLSATATRTSIPILGRVRSGSVTQRPETPKPPTLSLAVSLVASLTHDEQQEVLESKPVKSHPLLQALDEYVEKEMATHAANGKSTSSTAVENARLVPNAPGFSPSIDEKKTRKAPQQLPTSVSFEHLRSQLMSERFKRWLTGYYPRDFRRNKRQQRREHERKLLLGYDEAKLSEYTAAVPANVNGESSIRDREIAIGIQLAALDALVPWRLHGKAKSRWTPHASHCRSADEKDMLALASQVTPFLTQLQGVVKGKTSASDSTADDEAGEVHDPWMSVDYYVSRTNPAKEESETVMQETPLDQLPRLCVSTLESSLQVEIPAISEYTLRNFQPVAAAKPVDYAVVCPSSPSQWLATLTLSYLTMLRSVYAPSSLGDQVAMDLSGIAGNRSVSVDAASALMLVECTSTAEDAFATYRAAGELLQPLLAQGIKRKQAFSRSAVANVVFVVAPFRRSDIKHKMWLLGAFGRGLFGADDKPEWAGSVTVELLYLEDLVDVSLGTNPHALLPTAMALYDRVFEKVSLKPVAVGGESGAKSRFVCERLYHLAERASDDSTAVATAFVHAGYALSTDGKWLVAGFTDAVGAVLETKVFPVVSSESAEIETVLLSFAEAAFEFAALLGEKAVLAITQLGSSPVITDAWQSLTTQDAFTQLSSRFACVVTKIVVCQASCLSQDAVQVRPSPSSSVALCRDRVAMLVVRPDDASHFQERSRVANAKWLRSAERPTQETALLRVQLVHSVAVGDAAEADSEAVLSSLLTNWASLSYLTTHPVTLQRQSPLPLHLTAVDELHSELEMLATQLTTDPLALRR